MISTTTELEKKELEELVRDAYYLITRATWSSEGQDKFAASWIEYVNILGIEVDA